MVPERSAERVASVLPERGLIIGGILGVTLTTVTIGVLADRLTFSVLGGAVVFVGIVLVSIPLIRWVARREGDPTLTRVLFGALLLKLAMSLVRYYFIFVVYKGSGDAGVYDSAARGFVANIRDGNRDVVLPFMEGFPAESRRMGVLTGLLYLVVGSSAYSGFFVFAFLGYWGQVLAYRAFRLGVPAGDHRRYLYLVMFLPSLLFWPASIGKEAVMLLSLGLCCFGAALLLARPPRKKGVVVLACGLVAPLLIRPHIALMAIGALGVAVAVGLAGGWKGNEVKVRGRSVQLLLLAALLAVGAFALGRVSEVIADTGAQTTTAEKLDRTLASTSTGGSRFEPWPLRGVTDVVPSLASVVYRPWPWEISGFTAAIASAESALLLILTVSSLRRIITWPRVAWSAPYLVFTAGFMLAFVAAFSYVANFGILARQRVLLLPFLLTLLALPRSDFRIFGNFRRAEDAPRGSELVV